MRESTASPRRNPVVTHTLANGLQVYLRESHDAPIGSFWMWYRVGSRNEVPGKTGLSHWVEHLQFKGTPSIAKGAVFREVSRHGGIVNALTSHDWTAYFETLPIEQLDLSLRIESDRMRNSLFDSEETESERTVILSERQGAENNPAYLLVEEVFGTAFRAHPYRHMVLGHEADLRSITRDDLYNHYQRYYTPANAYITAAGDFDADDMIRRIEEHFGGIAAGEPAPEMTVREPPQLGERRVTLRRPAPTHYLWLGYRTPPAKHPDTAPLLVLDAVLSGAKGMGLAGGGAMGRSSRIYKALVASGLARSAGSDINLSLDPFLLTVGVITLPDADPERIEAIVDEQFARVREDRVPDDELARARKQIQAQYVYSAAGVTNQAFWLGQMELVDSYERADTLADELAAVTPDDLLRVAQTYLLPDNRTVGWLHPADLTPRSSGSNGASPASPPNVHQAWLTGTPDGRHPDLQTASRDAAPIVTDASTARTEARPFERQELPGGIVLLGQARPDDPIVVTRIRLAAGSLAESPEQAGLAVLTARNVTRGQAGRTFERFNELTDGMGASIGVDAGRLQVDLSMRCLREDLSAMLDLAADVLRRPDFPVDELEKVRQQTLGAIRESEDNTAAVADRTMRRLLYPEGHPYARRSVGEPETIQALTRDDLVRFHATHYGAATMTVGMVGGIADLDMAADMIATRFSDWDVDVTAPDLPGGAPIPVDARREAATLDGKSQADVIIGYPTLARDHEDYYALQTANLILGQLGLYGRLGAEVRDRQGMAYYVGSGLDVGKEAGVWTARAGVAPTNVDKAIDGITSELRRLQADLVDEDELADAQSYLVGVLPLALESNDGVAGTLLNIEYHDLGLDFLQRYPDIIRGLTREGLQRAAQRHLDPDRLVIGVAGPALPSDQGVETA